MTLTLIPLLPLVSASNSIATESATENFDFVVLGHDETPQEGAIVAISYYRDDSSATLETQILSTNEIGIATFEIPATAIKLNYVANPAPSDTANALPIYMRNSNFFDLKESRRMIQFEKADTFFELRSSNSNPAEIGSILFLNCSLVRGEILRSGPIGLNSTKLFDECSSQETDVYLSPRLNIDPTRVSFARDLLWRFKITRPESPEQAIFTDFITTEAVPKIDEIQQLAFSAANIRLQLLGTDGNPYRIPGYDLSLPQTLTNFYLNVSKVDDEGNTVYQAWEASSLTQFSVSGEAFGRLKNATAGRYQLKLESYLQDAQLPQMTKYFWLDSEGRFSNTASGPFQSLSLAEFTLTIPEKNIFRFQASENDGVGLSGFQAYFKDVITKNRQIVNVNFPNSTNSIVLADGEYSVDLDLPGRLTSFNLMMQNGVPAVRDLKGMLITARPSDGVYILNPDPPNVRFKILDPQDSSLVSDVYTYAYACPQQGGNCISAAVNQGLGSFNLPDGDWTITVQPYMSELFSKKSFTAQVNGSEITIDGVSKVDSYYEFFLNRNNIMGTIISPVTNSPVVFGSSTLLGLSLQVQKRSLFNGNWESTNNSIWSTNSKFGFAVIEEGEYRISLVPSQSSLFAPSTSNSFWIDSNGKVKTSDSETFKEIESNFVVTLGTANLTIKLSDSATGRVLTGGSVEVYKVENNGSYWYQHSWISSTGFARLNLDSDGSYRLNINPPTWVSNFANLSRQKLTATKSGSSISLSLPNGTPILPDGSGIFNVGLQPGNVQGSIATSEGESFSCLNNQWVGVGLQKYNLMKLFWDTIDWINFNCVTRAISHQISEEGTYRVQVEPWGFPSQSVGYSDSFTVTTDSIGTNQIFNLGVIKMGKPSIRVAVTDPDSTTRLEYVGISVSTDNQWIGWFNTGPLGIASIKLDAPGEYRFEVHPNNQSLLNGAARKSYKVLATRSEDGSIVATANPGSGVTFSALDSVTVLSLGVPNLRGIVNSSDEAPIPIRDSQVVPKDLSTGRELWEFSTATDIQGRWSMTLPEGNYSIQARTPWGSSSYAHSNPIATVSVNSLGEVNLSGIAADSRTPTSFNISLRPPKWKGQVFEPTVDGVPSTKSVPYPWVCLMTDRNWYCAQGDKDGRWALTPDSEFADFSEDAIFEIRDNHTNELPLLRFEGKSAVENSLGAAGNINLRHEFKSVNVYVQVLAGGKPVPFTWVNLDRYLFNGRWLGGNLSNSQGLAKFRVDDLNEFLTVTVDVANSGTLSNDYVRTTKTFAGTTGESLTITINLDTPNFRGVLREPATVPADGQPVAYSWLNVFNETKGLWSTGANTDRNGRFALNLEAPSDGSATIEYTITAYPSWNSNSDATMSRYSVEVNSVGELKVRNKGKGTPVPSEQINENSFYTISLGVPSISGSVVRPDNSPVEGSLILPIEAQQKFWLWEYHVYSRLNGSFAMNIPDGEYFIQGKRPWYESNLADSAYCKVKVSGEQVVEHGVGCEDGTDSTTKIKLTLREPNLKFKLVDDEGKPIVGAFVNIGYGSWNTWANSSSSGEVSLFVDTEAIKLLNSWITDENVSVSPHIWVDPPWASVSNKMVRWNCTFGADKPICKDLTSFALNSPFPQTDLKTITALGPNTLIEIKNPNSSTKARFGTWVNVFEISSNCSRCSWIEGSFVDPQGRVALNLNEDPTKRFAIEVYPNWEDRNTYAQKFHDNGGLGYTRESLTSLTFDLASPNLYLEIKAPNNIDPSKWATLSIEVVDPATFEPLYGYKWIQLDQVGKGGVLLEKSKTYQLSIRPGNGQSGSTTRCVVNVDASSIVTTNADKCWNATVDSSKLVLNLSSGNVTGRVLLPNGTPAAKVVIYSNYQETTTTSVVATTDKDGIFNLELGNLYDWTITAIPVSTDGSTSQYSTASVGVSKLELKALEGLNRLTIPDIVLTTK